jgi:hypothetical protein
MATATIASVGTTYQTITGTYSIAVTDDVIIASGSTAYAVTLPTAVNVLGKTYTIKSVMDAGIGLTVNTTSNQLIDSATSITLPSGNTLQLVSNGTKWVSIISQPDPNPFSFKNRIINGDMRIDQRLAGNKNTTVSGSYTYGIDKFTAYVQTGSSASLQRLALATTDNPLLLDGLKYYLRYNRESVVGIANDIHMVAQHIEANNIEDLLFGITNAKKQFTVSFWAKASSSYNFSLTFANTIAGATRTYVIPFNVTTSWQKYTYTVPVDTTGVWGTAENVGLSVRFVFGGSGTTTTFNQWKADNNYVGGTTQFQALTQNSFFDVTGLQLEEGFIATSFEKRPYAVELSLCQRYCTVLNADAVYTPFGLGFAKSTTNADILIQLPIRMRTVPPSASVTTSGSFQISDGVTSSAVSSFSVPVNQNSTRMVTVTAASSGLTAFRPMRLESANNTTAKITVDVDF